jgi:hypothetical protein
VAGDRGPQPEAGQAAGRQSLQQVGELGGRPREDRGVTGVRLAGERVEPVAAGLRSGPAVVEEDDEVAEDVQGLVGAARRLLLGAERSRGPRPRRAG